MPANIYRCAFLMEMNAEIRYLKAARLRSRRILTNPLVSLKKGSKGGDGPTDLILLPQKLLMMQKYGQAPGNVTPVKA